MKSDINLLQKPKRKQYSSKKLITLLLVIAAIVITAYTGFTLPGSALTDAQQTVADLNSNLSVSGVEENLAALSDLYAQRTEQLKALSAIASAKSDMIGYLEAVELSLPTTANITRIEASNFAFNITGTAEDDDTIASFCLHLRQSGKFVNVFLVSSTLMDDANISFQIQLTLPVTLDSTAVLPEAETTDQAGEVTP